MWTVPLRSLQVGKPVAIFVIEHTMRSGLIWEFVVKAVCYGPYGCSDEVPFLSHLRFDISSSDSMVDRSTKGRWFVACRFS